MARKKIAFTKAGFEKTQKEHDELEVQRIHAVKELTIARDMGDRSENGFYKAARWRLSSIDSRLRHLKHLLRFGEIVEREFSGKVDIGTEVKVHNGTTDMQFVIVGGYESDLTQGKISFYSPIGKALMGKKEGDIVNVIIPAGIVKYTILSVKGEE